MGQPLAFGLNDGSNNSQNGRDPVDIFAADHSVTQRRNSLEDRIVHAFEQWRIPIYRYLYLAGGNPAEAEEITQECFVRLFQALRGGQSIEHIQRWLFRVAHNLLIDRTRGPQARSISTNDTASFLENRLDPQPNPEQRLLTEERLSQMHRAIQGLTSLQRNCIQLRAEGFRHREIAEILGISMDSVADALRRGLTRLSRQSNE